VFIECYELSFDNERNENKKKESGLSSFLQAKSTKLRYKGISSGRMRCTVQLLFEAVD